MARIIYEELPILRAIRNFIQSIGIFFDELIESIVDLFLCSIEKDFNLEVKLFFQQFSNSFGISDTVREIFIFFSWCSSVVWYSDDEGLHQSRANLIFLGNSFWFFHLYNIAKRILKLFNIINYK